jgi:tetratricopeptide (TPR) repeat protein
LPTVTQIHEVCFALNAEEEEITALTCGNLRFAGGQAQTEPLLCADALEDRLEKLQMRIAYGEQRLIELEALHLKRQAWGLAARQPNKRHLLAYAWHVHGKLYSIHERFEEAARLAQEGMELLPEKNFLPKYALYMTVDVANGFAYRRTRPNPRRGVEFLRSWLNVDRHPHLVTWLRSEMAEILAHSGDSEAAVAISKEACELAVNFSPREQARRAGAHAEILLHSARRPAEALKALPLPSSQDSPIFNAEVGILHAEILAALNETSDAQRRVAEVQQMAERYQLTELLPRLNAVQQRLSS